ncbi:hypothetical protein [Actinomadura atramentaria]|uniref:hypothetical protein n=1 Tax=Actinomadura atramentaria TaxID=1990 RepID=UPI0003A9D8FD|nr:hypothetical protein [Actinomadura atramentaria]
MVERVAVRAARGRVVLAFGLAGVLRDAVLRLAVLLDVVLREDGLRFAVPDDARAVVLRDGERLDAADVPRFVPLDEPDLAVDDFDADFDAVFAVDAFVPDDLADDDFEAVFFAVPLFGLATDREDVDAPVEMALAAVFIALAASAIALVALVIALVMAVIALTEPLVLVATDFICVAAAFACVAAAVTLVAAALPDLPDVERLAVDFLAVVDFFAAGREAVTVDRDVLPAALVRLVAGLRFAVLWARLLVARPALRPDVARVVLVATDLPPVLISYGGLIPRHVPIYTRFRQNGIRLPRYATPS